MIWLILSLVLVVVVFSVEAYAYAYNHDEFKFRPFMLTSLIPLLLILVGLFTWVPANSVGIVYDPFKNGVSENTLSEGFHGKGLFDKVYTITTEVQTMTVDNLTTQTQDAQFLNSTLDIKYRISASNAFVVFKQFRTLDKLSNNLVVPTTQRVLELVTTQYNVIDILGEKRSDIYNELNKSLAEEFAKYGVEFYSISITDMDAGEALEAAITAEAVAKKSVETAEQNLLKTQTEAKQKSVEAQAEQDAAKIKAETKLIEAEAEKKANELLSKSLDDLILRKEWIEKWNGVVPTYYGGSGQDMILNLPAETIE